MEIRKQRAERSNLQRIVSGTWFGSSLREEEQAEVLGLWRSARHDPANSVMDVTSGVRLITSGWAGWMRYADDGRRLIFLFLMPGDFIVPGLFEPGSCDLVTLSPLRSVDASTLHGDARTVGPQPATIIANSERYYRMLLIDQMTRLTRGCTTRSLASLLMEFHARAVRAGTSDEGRFSLPIGQRVLGRALGRSTVQINKVINQFQVSGLVKVGYDWVEILQPTELRTMAGLAHSVDRPAHLSAAIAR